MMSWLLSTPNNLLIIPNSLERLGGFISGETLSFGTLTASFNRLINPILTYYQTLSWFTSPGLSITCCILVFFIYCLSTLFTVTVLLIKLETVFIVIGGAFTAAFFVIGQFRDIFMGYIKALAMNGLKLLLLSLCLGLMIRLMDGWGAELQAAVARDGGIYDTAIPMTFGLMAFYIILKSVPQYAVAILTGHASADGSLARAAVMAGIATAGTVWNVSRGISNTAINTASTVNNAAQAYKIGRDTAISGGSSIGAARAMGAWEATKTVMTSPIGGRGGISGGSRGTVSGAKAANNEMKPGGAFDAYTPNQLYGADPK